MAAISESIGGVAPASLVYPNEKRLFGIAVVLSVIAWLLVVVGTIGIALVYVLIAFVAYLFVQSALISYLRGTATQITPQQFPDLHERIRECCRKLGMDSVPDAYLLHADGAFNAFATRFLGRNFIVLYSDVVDALEAEPEALNFYIGHELGHIRRNHLMWGPVLFPASILPLLGAAYSRAREYTCDRHGLACCSSARIASQGLAAIAAGSRRWKTLDAARYANQSASSGGFWMSFHELTASYPWLVKRMARLLGGEHETQIPRRSVFAWALAAFVPRLSPAGGGASLLVTVAMIGVLAAVAIPAYQDYKARASVNLSLQEGDRAAAALADYYYRNGTVPATLEAAGFSVAPSALVRRIANDEEGNVHIELAFAPLEGKSVTLVPSLDDNKRVVWKCASRDIAPKYLPVRCRQ